MQPISLITFFHLSFPIYFHFSHATNFSCHIFCHLGFLFTYFHSSISHNPSLSSPWFIVSFTLLSYNLCYYHSHYFFSLFTKIQGLHFTLTYYFQMGTSTI
jgi:hypothetical protein